jgi:hypothetical protein
VLKKCEKLFYFIKNNIFMINVIRERKIFSSEKWYWNSVISNYAISLKQSVQESLNHIEALRQSIHPRKNWLLDWIDLNNENKKWYLENIWKKVDLIQDGILLLGDIFELNDEEFLGKWNWILNDSWNTFFSWEASKKHVKSVWKEMVFDWWKYIDFLPWNDKNKIFFLQKVLWLNLLGYWNWYIYRERWFIPIMFKRKWKTWFYWWLNENNGDANHLVFDKNEIEISNINKNFFYRLRCLKKKWAE